MLTSLSGMLNKRYIAFDINIFIGFDVNSSGGNFDYYSQHERLSGIEYEKLDSIHSPYPICPKISSNDSTL